MSTMAQVEENLACASVSHVHLLNEKELNLVTQVRAKYNELSPIPCTQCEYCLPCPTGVEIPRNFSAYNQGKMYDKPEVARRAYTQFIPEAGRASACLACLECEDKCPQKIPISDWLPIVHRVLGEGEPYGATPAPVSGA
jgi:predicted aldo/keto reductase-like oxidoreductase